MNTRTKQITQLADIEMAMDRRPIAYLKMIHSQFPFADLKAALDRKPGKRHPQQLFQGYAIGFRQQIRDKIFDIVPLNT